MSDTIVGKNQKTEIIKGHLRWAALFLGELRDGLTMVCTVVILPGPERRSSDGGVSRFSWNRTSFLTSFSL